MSVASVLSLRRADVVAMLREMGFQTADRWDDDKMVRKLKELPSMLADETEKLPEPQSEEGREMLANICEAVESDMDIEMEQAHHNNGALEAPAKKGGKKGAKAKAGKVKANKADKPAKEKAKMDKLGSRQGSKTALINARLSSKPKTMSQLASEAGLEGTFYNHLNKLVADGKVEKTDEGYRLKK